MLLIHKEFNSLLLNSIGFLSVILVCFIRASIGKWSDISCISMAESKFHCSTSLINMLSINVAVFWIILVGQVIVSSRPLFIIISKNLFGLLYDYYFLTDPGYDPFLVLVVCLSLLILPWGLFHSSGCVIVQLRCLVADTDYPL